MLITDEQLTTLILKTGILDQKGVTVIQEYAKNASITLQDALIEKDVISDENLGILISDFLKIPFVVLSKITVSPDVFSVIPERLARKMKVIPFERDANGVKLAMVDPSDTEIIQLIQAKTGQKVLPHLATERDIYNTLRVYRQDLQKKFDEMMREELQKTHGVTISDVPVGKILDAIINYAYQDKSSDIHIEPLEKSSLVRFRIDGILHDVLTLPKELHDQVITRIKVLSRLRTDEHLSPQDGKMRMTLDEEELDIRVSILPLATGEKAVLRLLASRFRQFSLVDLGMNESDLKKS